MYTVSVLSVGLRRLRLHSTVEIVEFALKITTITVHGLLSALAKETWDGSMHS